MVYTAITPPNREWRNVAEHSEAKPKGGRTGPGSRAPIDNKTRARVRKLAREGMSQNAVARAVGISGSTVGRICAAANPPILFDRSKTKAAVAAHTLDLKAVRMGISEKAIAEVQRLFGLFTSEHEVINWHEGSMSTGRTSGPTSGDIKNYATSIGILIDKHLVLVRHDSDDRDLSAVDAWIAHVQGSAPEVPEEWK
jgi:hypothetical protein